MTIEEIGRPAETSHCTATMMRRWLLGPVVALWVLMVGPASGCRNHEPCVDEPCECTGAGACDLDCGDKRGCTPYCDSFDGDCREACADDCSLHCSGGPNCQATCGVGCQIVCERASTCNTTCGSACNYLCDNVSNCAPHVGDGSTVTCQSVGNCNAVCTGACRVHCQSVGNCNAACAAGASAQSCTDGWACGQGC